MNLKAEDLLVESDTFRDLDVIQKLIGDVTVSGTKEYQYKKGKLLVGKGKALSRRKRYLF